MATASDSSPHQSFFLLSCAGFASIGGMRICDAMLPALAADFQTTPGSAASVVSFFVIAYGVCQLIYGPLGDRYGKAVMIRWAVIASAVINLAILFAPTLASMTALRTLAGAVAAGIMPLSLAFIGDAVPYQQRQAVLAQFLAAVILGMLLGQWAGGVFADTVGWHWAFGALSAIFAVIAIAMIRNLPSANGVTTSQEPFMRQMASVVAIPWARRIGALAFVEGAFVFSILVFVPTYLHQQFGLSLSLSGAVVTLFGIGGLLYAMTTRQLLARLGERGLAGYGGILMGIGLAMLTLGPTWYWALPACFLFGLGFYMLHNTLQTHATQMAPHARGTGVAMFAALLFLGQSVGIVVLAQVVDLWGIRASFVSGLIALPLIGALFTHLLIQRNRRAAG